jgi:glutathionyl-hydroquinone reductase
VSYACPWAHRTLIFKTLKGLQDVIGVTVVNPLNHVNGWAFNTPDSVNHANFLYEIYTKADPHYTGKVSVPVLWDTKNQTIVNNESAEIIRMFNSAFVDYATNNDGYYPEHLQTEVDEINDVIYNHVSNGVYRCGFAQSQDAYDAVFVKLFDTLDMLEARLKSQQYLVGDTLTEADWRLFVTLVRFDVVYVGLFKCNLKRIADYPNLSRYWRALYDMPSIKDTVNLEHIKQHYYGSLKAINPNSIVPTGPTSPL